MRLHNSFHVPAGLERSWQVLLDVPGVAGCLPGARLTEVVDESTYKGEASVKIGPVAMTFAGEAKIIERDDATHRAKVQARGADKRGRGNARAEMVFELAPADGGTRVEVVTELQLAGAVAQYGRGAGLMEAIASEIIGEFARNLEARLRAEEGGAAGAAAAEAPARDGSPAAGQAPAGAGQETAGSLNAVSLLWRALVSWLRRLLGWPARR